MNTKRDIRKKKIVEKNNKIKANMQTYTDRKRLDSMVGYWVRPERRYSWRGP
jgi:hypothetical protein